jgi:ABC-type branched-subunit amino acid transport system substrate-binding protein
LDCELRIENFAFGISHFSFLISHWETDVIDALHRMEKCQTNNGICEMRNDRGETFYIHTAMSLVAVSMWSIFFAACLLLSGCSEHAKKMEESGPAKIAVVVPHTGPLMEEGQMLQLGALMARREAEGRVADLSLEVVVYDSPCDPEEGVATAKRLTTDVTISAVIGYLCAETLGAVLPLYQDAWRCSASLPGCGSCTD